MGAETPQAGNDLKRLGFVRDNAEYYYNKGYGLANYVYSTGKQYTPESLKPTLNNIEGQVGEYSTPLLKNVQETSEKLLSLVDSKVDGAVVVAHDMYANNQEYLQKATETPRQLHGKYLEDYKQAKDASAKLLEQAVDFLKENGVTGATRYAVDRLGDLLEKSKQIPAYLESEVKQNLKNINDAWNKVKSYPAAQKLLASVQPTVDYTWKKYLSLHDTLVATPAYHKAVELGVTVSSKAQDTVVYKAATNRFYPLVAPYADPALEKITHSSYFSAVLEHLKPIPANHAK